MTLIQKCLIAIGEIDAERRHRPENCRETSDVKLFFRNDDGLCELFAFTWSTGNFLDIWHIDMIGCDRVCLGQIELGNYNNSKMAQAVIMAGYIKAYFMREED